MIRSSIARLFPVLLASFVVTITLGGCASSPQQRAQDFHDWVSHRHDNGSKSQVIVDELAEPNTCWSLTQPKVRTDMVVLERVPCEPHKTILERP